MALTDAQKLSVYECLGVTFGAGGGTQADSATIHNGFGVTLTLSQMDTLRDQLDAHLAGVTTAVETKIAALVVAWDAIRLCTGKMESGAIGDLSGMSDSFEDKRAHFRSLMQVYVPVMHMVEAMRRRTGERPLTIGIIR